MLPIQITVYGLKSCDGCRKARKWLDAHGLAHDFHDFRAAPPGGEAIATWLAAVGSDKLLNRRGTTWRGLGEADKARAEAGTKDLIALLAQHPALMKRPVIEAGGNVLVGFDSAVQSTLEKLG
ncbi:MAG: arsenate reductase [Rhodospirillales bacterium]